MADTIALVATASEAFLAKSFRWPRVHRSLTFEGFALTFSIGLSFVVSFPLAFAFGISRGVPKGRFAESLALSFAIVAIATKTLALVVGPLGPPLSPLPILPISIGASPP